MKNVKIINKLFLFCILSLFLSLQSFNKNKFLRINKEPLMFEISFKDFGNVKLAFDEKKMEIDTIVWKNHEKDNVVLFKINLENLNKKSFYVRTHLVGNKMPFLIKYSKGKKDQIVLEIVQLLNTVYSDSLIFKKSSLQNFVKTPILNQVFNVGYQKSGIKTICKFKPKYKKDTIDISNQTIQNCIERPN